LLNHPFVLNLSLKPFGSKVPHSFVTRALQNGLDHAAQLVYLLRTCLTQGDTFNPLFMHIVLLLRVVFSRSRHMRNPHSSCVVLPICWSASNAVSIS
jgi:hypothetical protein